MKKYTEAEIDAILGELDELRGKLSDSQKHNAEQAARASYFADANTEVPTGRKVTIKRCKNPWVKKEDDQIWEDVEVDTFYFKVDMPPVGGIQIMLDGEAIQQGETYEVTEGRLRTLKEIVYRLQAHDKDIHGSDEHLYRPRVSKIVSAKSGVHDLPVQFGMAG